MIISLNPYADYVTVFSWWIVDALQEITSTMGAKFWKFNGDSCKIEMVGVTADPPKGSETGISCDCNSTVCHVVTLYGSLILFLNNFVHDYVHLFEWQGLSFVFIFIYQEKRKENKRREGFMPDIYIFRVNYTNLTWA